MVQLVGLRLSLQQSIEFSPAILHDKPSKYGLPFLSLLEFVRNLSEGLDHHMLVPQLVHIAEGLQ